MTSLLTLAPGGPTARPWEVDATPHVYDDAVREQMRAMPGVRWVRDVTSANGRGFFRGPREAVEIVATLLESAAVVRVRDDRGATSAPLPPNGEIAGAGLRPYQQDGAAWLRHAMRTTGAALLADDMGLGKSAQTIAALEGRPVLVVCPAVVVPHWRGQFARWGSSLDEFEAMSYERFTKRVKDGTIGDICASVAVFDECQYLSNSKAQRSQAARKWLTARRSGGHSTDVIALSGTPMTARPRDLWHVLDLLWPERWGSFFDFTRRYCAGHWKEIPNVEKTIWISDGASRESELGVRLASCMLRRTKSQVATELPPKSRVMIEVELPRTAARDSARARAAVDWSGGPLGASITSLLSHIETHKIDAAVELAEQAVTSGERVLILTTRKDTAREIARRIEGAAVTTGDDDPESRAATLADVTVGVATLYSVTTGIDLVQFSTLIFVGLDWVPSTLLQCEARLDRIGQTRPVTIYYLIALETVDEVVRERVIERLEVFGAVVGGGDGEQGLSAALGGGTEDDLIAQLVAGVRERERQAA